MICNDEGWEGVFCRVTLDPGKARDCRKAVQRFDFPGCYQLPEYLCKA